MADENKDANAEASDSNADASQVTDSQADSSSLQAGPPSEPLIDLEAADKQLAEMAAVEAAAEAAAKGSPDGQDGASDGKGKDPPPASNDEARDGKEGRAFKPTDEQLAMAKQLGVPQEEIDVMTKEQADAYVLAGKVMSRRAAEAGRKAGDEKAGKGDEEGAGAGEAAGEGGGAGSSDPPPKVSFSNDDDWGTKAGAEKINQMAEGYKALRQEISGLRKELQDSKVQGAVNAADKFFEDLDAEVYPEAADQEFQTKVIEAATTARDSFRETYGQELTDAEALDRGLMIADPEKAKQAAAASVRKQVAQRSKSITSQPTKRQTSGRHFASPEEEAAANIKAEAEAAGMSGLGVR